MVGHTGDIEATVVACKAADEAVKVSTNKTKYMQTVISASRHVP
jgi:bisphosphoglycerate-independent phosphoglycerate mutase (AlkP superfamily)